ncbi:sulfotransferase family 2 domain-containing protein [Okeanomitos corallinicola TIOX110]|uniref:Sulfotransferase family 2 domain-containing protein n=1 Tax=Okeanomitos corallinicola TIOX110 TaxID=3133117 RepID=A0ABZ2UQD4_9CYAN
MSPEKFIIFIHIQKTAGLSVQKMIRRRYGSSFFQRIANKVDTKINRVSPPKSLKEKMLSCQFSDCYFMGHFCYGVHEFLPQPSKYITFLREPISRLLSLYFYSKANTTAYYHKQAVNATMEEFFFKSHLMELDNGILRFIVGDQNNLFINRTPVGKFDVSMLEQAQENIINHFECVGFSERFDESVLLLKNKLGWKNSYYLKRNISAKSKNKENINPALIEELKSKNSLDIKLYQFAMEKFEQEINSLGSPFQNELQVFRKNNEIYNQFALPIYNQYDYLKAIINGNKERPI